jgi:chemotaxis signal transduction protein
MATLLRSRRFADRATEATHQYITFQLRQSRFALPIQNLKRVSQLKGENDPINDLNADLSSPAQEQEEVRFIDVDQRIFDAVNSPAINVTEVMNPQQQSCVILFSDDAGRTVGLAIDTQPKMRRIAQSQIVPLLDAKTHPTHLQSVCVSMIQVNGESPIFLLDLDKLCKL